MLRGCPEPLVESWGLQIIPNGSWWCACCRATVKTSIWALWILLDIWIALATPIFQVTGILAEFPNTKGGVFRPWATSSCRSALANGDLHLYGNELESLPLRFSTLRVGGNLYLNNNDLRYLPPNFEQIRVGGNLNLDGNPWPELTSIPNEFPNVEGIVSWWHICWCLSVH